MTYKAPFAGICVVDLTQSLAGPEAGMLLAQYGADVIKVEPLTGDWSRHQGDKFGDFTDKTISNNRGKKSIALDLKGDAGKDILQRLLRYADVFLEAFRPGVIQRLGFGYGEVAAYNPGLIYLSIFRVRPDWSLQRAPGDRWRATSLQRHDAGQQRGDGWAAAPDWDLGDRHDHWSLCVSGHIDRTLCPP